MLDRLEKARVVRANAGAPEHFEDSRLWKLRRAAQAAIDRVEHVAQLLRGGIEFLDADDDFARWPRFVGEPCQQRCAVALDFFRLLAKQPRHFAQDIGERWPPEPRLFRKVSPAPHRLALGREKHGQRPTAVLAQEM